MTHDPESARRETAAAALTSSVVAEVARSTEVALLIETAVADEDSPSIGYLAFIPEPGSPATVLRGLGLPA